MPTYSGNTIDNDFLYVVVNSTQNQATNQSTISWALYWAFRSPSPTDRDLDNGTLTIGGVNVYNNANPYNYTGNFTVRDILLGSGSRAYTHGSDGNLTVAISASCKPWQNPESTISASYVLPRIPKVPSAPGTPTATADASVEGRVSVSWSTPADNGGSTITGYKVYRVSNNALLATTSGSGTTTNISGLTVGDTLAFYVKATNAIGDSASSANSNSVLVNGNPPAPTLSTVTTGTVNAGTLVATWTAPAAVPTAITGYTVEMSSNNIDWLTWVSVSAATLSTTLTGITPNSLRYIRVRARNAFSDANSTFGPASSTISATSSGPPGPPTGLSAQNTADLGTVPANSIKLTWVAPASTGNPAGVTGYNIYWYKSSLPGTIFSDSVGAGVLTYTTPANLSPTPESYVFYVIAKNSLSSGQDGWSVASGTITKSAITPGGWVDNTLSPTIRVGIPYSDQLTFVGSYESYSVTGTLPPGLSFTGPASNVLTLSGTPTTQGTYNFTVSIVTAGDDPPAQPLTLIVRPGGYRKDVSSQVPITILRRFDGISWVDVEFMRRWNGSTFVDTGMPTL